jgi:hypothetical protein
MLLGQYVKRFALGDTLLELFGLFGGFHQDMAGLCFHVSIPSNCKSLPLCLSLSHLALRRQANVFPP